MTPVLRFNTAVPGMPGVYKDACKQLLHRLDLLMNDLPTTMGSEFVSWAERLVPLMVRHNRIPQAVFMGLNDYQDDMKDLRDCEEDFPLSADLVNAKGLAVELLRKVRRAENQSWDGHMSSELHELLQKGRDVELEIRRDLQGIRIARVMPRFVPVSSPPVFQTSVAKSATVGDPQSEPQLRRIAVLAAQ